MHLFGLTSILFRLKCTLYIKQAPINISYKPLVGNNTPKTGNFLVIKICRFIFPLLGINMQLLEANAYVNFTNFGEWTKDFQEEECDAAKLVWFSTNLLTASCRVLNQISSTKSRQK